MSKKKKILFIQHASQFGGSAMSLLYTLQGIKSNAGDKYEVIVALAKWTKPLSEFYLQAGFEVVKPKWIDTYEHTQAVSYNLLNPLHFTKEIIQIIKIKKAIKHTVKLIDEIKPDIIHLNSVVLVGSAIAAKSKSIPLVWHVREPSISGLFKLRLRILINLLKKVPHKVIFICKSDSLSWGNPLNSEVVYNFIDFEKFDYKKIQPYELNGAPILKTDLTILFLGGVASIKGGLFLFKAFNRLMLKYPEKKMQLLIPGGIYGLPNYFIYRFARIFLPYFGQGTYSQKIEKEISKSTNPEFFLKLPFVKDVAQLLAASDVLIFPSIRPHFARPIIEAGAMAKPVIGSNLGGVTELIEDSKNGFLVKPKSIDDLVEKMSYFIENKDEIKRMGLNGYDIAREKYQAKKNISQIIKIYDTLAS